MATIKVHNQQLCGLAWSSDGQLFASSGNDNLCCLFDVDETFGSLQTSQYLQSDRTAAATVRQSSSFSPRFSPWSDTESPPGPTYNSRHLHIGSEKHRWVHRAAIKAIAFHPCNSRLIATGGGSNDKCIHFFDTASGHSLATIAVSAQVTSLTWSTTGHEIAATFGYAHPEHPFRIAVFRWPSCQQTVAIPWDGELRALCAIPFPLGRRGSVSSKFGPRNRGSCIVVAASDQTVKFHKVWPHCRFIPCGKKASPAAKSQSERDSLDREDGVIR